MSEPQKRRATDGEPAYDGSMQALGYASVAAAIGGTMGALIVIAISI